MVEGRFDHERNKQVVVEAADPQAVTMENNEEGIKVCGVTTSRKCLWLVVVSLLVVVRLLGLLEVSSEPLHQKVEAVVVAAIKATGGADKCWQQNMAGSKTWLSLCLTW